MEVKWNNFRTSWPDRVFYLLSATGETNTGNTISTLCVPPSFLEEADPAKVESS